MNGAVDILHNEDYTPVWNRVLFSNDWPIDPNESLILTLRTDQAMVSAKQIGPPSSALSNALLEYQQDWTGLCNLESTQSFQYIESEHSFSVGELPQIKFGMITPSGSKLNYLPVFEWLKQKQTDYALTYLTAEHLLEEADYQVNYLPLVQSLLTCLQRSNLHIELAVLDSRDSGMKHRLGWERKPIQEVFRAEQMVTNLLVNNDSDECITYQGKIIGEAQLEHLIVPIIQQHSCVSCLIFSADLDELMVLKPKLVWLQKLLTKGYELDLEESEARKRDLLLEVTKKFHSTMDISEVLDKIVYAIKKTYPAFEVYLMLSHEWEVEKELPIKPLLYGSEGMNAKAEHAFLTGMKQVDCDQENHCVHLFVPLRGKQGIYGVLEVLVKELETLPKEEVSFIELLADTGGNALENAELYKQSRDLIHDLKLINKATHQINMNLNLNDLIESMTIQIQDAFGAEEVGFLLFDRNDHSVIHQSGTVFFQEAENIERFTKLIGQLLTKKDSIYIGDTSLHPDVESGLFRSMLAIPMVHKQSVHGAVFVTHQESYHFTFESFKLLQSLVHHSTLAFTNTLLHEELEKLVITDHLTNLHSRNHLEASMDQSLEEHENGTFLLIDIDNFKRINDTYGHQIGDEIIVQVANIIRQNIRETDIAARWGGEELAVYLPKVKLNTGIEIAKRIVKAVATETNPNVTISCGVSFWGKEDVKTISSGSLFKHADAGLYKAKKEGKNQVILMD
ncbi:sensor domain-containing diguanylate cyclase [Alkalicoccobacillus porphyridii]|uniref:Diguanylate cyclase n=1 Tax=Alkalicoccobacillus porphyridii TaxID=2597270 RepID=A0A554A2Y6_9BACI|nr:sensor domain-containing diguanylate cyclase [Alkalicoccobacillus porphyridii]TSB48069.1 diguanylate cyclase [Alkalicoccobacillus porphyridii]